jgi:Zn-finger nucleic acid-binding protein
MIVLELGQVETDYCPACGGIWLDSGELELLFEDAQQARQIVSSFRQAPHTKEKARSCPICLKKMRKIFSRRRQPVVIDRCPKGHGLWFDRGELPLVLSKAGFDREQKIIKLLSGIFSHNKSEVKNGG